MTIYTGESTALTAAALQDSIHRYVRYTLGKRRDELSLRDLFLAVTLTVRERLLDAMIDTEERYQRADAKRLYYLSMEFLMGRSLENNLSNLGLLDLCRETIARMGYDLDQVMESEPDAALGTGGLGRLAACFLDSLATLGMPGFGYGINYEYGLFRQEIKDGYQKEQPDNWLAHGIPWQIKRPEEACVIPVYGKIEDVHDRDGNPHPVWLDYNVMLGVPNDMPVVGYGGRTVNYLRLYSARSSQEFDIAVFNNGDYRKAVEQKIATETITKVLYPSDSVKAGRELRLVQEYFLVACAVRDIVRRYLKDHERLEDLPSKVAIQLNDTHPALAIAELMRLLVDEKELSWETAWAITHETVAYTNHTLLPEALEKWPESLIEYVLPRHLQIIHEIDRRFLDEVITVLGDDRDRLDRMSIFEDGEHKHVRMAHLAMVGSHSVNGVAALHTALIETSLAADFYQLWPSKFNNKTNGVTQRRWLLKANPHLSKLITEAIGDRWITDLEKLRDLDPFCDDPVFQGEFKKARLANKERLARLIAQTTGVVVDPDSLFDVHVKRIHEYKRQLLNCMHIIHEYLCLIEDNRPPTVPRTYIFAGKAAPSYWAAKQIIKLINSVAEVVNGDPRTGGQIKVVFVPDYRVSLAERIIPAADLSEQISTAGMEASGTGNMKFAMNGALTIGTLDGANIEILEEVGADNIFTFGLRFDQIRELRKEGSYNPREIYETNGAVKRVMDSFTAGLFNPREPGLFDWIYQTIVDGGDCYFHLADLPSYLDAHERAARLFNNHDKWARKAILNVARIGKFSSDRTIWEYARDIWNIEST
ncbi:MAG TPA: glycogen/starch/alpha-glucan phosphorylase [Blastocatellia bacterium]|nr:glycogen/starch/alpha-glucan phosphorylase [Blastocatellia bacterium]